MDTTGCDPLRRTTNVRYTNAPSPLVRAIGCSFGAADAQFDGQTVASVATETDASSRPSAAFLAHRTATNFVPFLRPFEGRSGA